MKVVVLENGLKSDWLWVINRALVLFKNVCFYLKKKKKDQLVTSNTFCVNETTKKYIRIIT